MKLKKNNRIQAFCQHLCDVFCSNILRSIWIWHYKYNSTLQKMSSFAGHETLTKLSSNIQCYMEKVWCPAKDDIFCKALIKFSSKTVNFSHFHNLLSSYLSKIPFQITRSHLLCFHLSPNVLVKDSSVYKLLIF